MLLATLAGGHAARRMTCGRGGKQERGIGLAGHAVLALNRVRLAGSSASRAAKGAAAVNAGHQRLRRVTACAEHTRSYNTVQTKKRTIRCKRVCCLLLTRVPARTSKAASQERRYCIVWDGVNQIALRQA